MPVPVQLQGFQTAASFHSGCKPEDRNLSVISNLAQTAGNEQLRQRVQDAYEHGDLVSFDAPRLPLYVEDWDFLNSFHPPHVADNNRLKKAKMPDMLAPVDSKYGPNHVLHALGLDKKQAVRLQVLILRVNTFVDKAVRALFPNYKVLNAAFTWRLTPTLQEEMHYDSYGTSVDENHKVRVFINLDEKPRVWATSHRVGDAISIYKDRLRDADATLPPNLFNDQINKRIPWQEMPRNFFAFAPGSLWLVNSQIVAHEIIFGRKMIGFTMDVDHSSLRDPELRFQSVVRRAIKEAGLRA